MDINRQDFSPFISTPLCEIMGRNKSDKGHLNLNESWHNYTTFYYHIFKDVKDKAMRIFELGIGTNYTDIESSMGVNGRPGASLYGWREFFVNSHIYSADIDKRILFNDERIRTFYCDQTKPDVISQLWNEPMLKDGFDIMIEDGLHTFDANVCFFENSIHKLNSGGYYIIEDILNNYIPSFNHKIKEWKIRYPHLIFELISLPSKRNYCDNNLLVIKSV